MGYSLVMEDEFFRTTSVTDFKLKNVGTPPNGHPSERHEDTFSITPFELDYNKRKIAFINHKDNEIIAPGK
jgi:hypothetical protein